jgi:ABC-type multidrug transport system ATPase subunit
MKRRLSVALCLIGDPRVLFLDEPTSGMDPIGKRVMWNLIRKLREERVIVLSTHSMEEADSVGDKIAILALGRLRAIGTPMHLKQRYGMGYSVTLVTTEDKLPSLKSKVLLLFGIEDDDEKSMSAVGLQLASETTSTLTYTIYRTSPQQMRLVSRFFQFLEEQQEGGEHVLVHDFIVSHTTLEDVFLRLTHGEGMIIENDESTWDNEERIMDMQRTIRELEERVTGLTMRLKQVEEENEQLKQ